MITKSYTAIRVYPTQGEQFDILVDKTQLGLGEGQVDAIKGILFNNSRLLITFTGVNIARHGQLTELRAAASGEAVAEILKTTDRADTFVLNMGTVVSATFMDVALATL